MANAYLIKTNIACDGEYDSESSENTHRCRCTECDGECSCIESSQNMLVETDQPGVRPGVWQRFQRYLQPVQQKRPVYAQPQEPLLYRDKHGRVHQWDASRRCWWMEKDGWLYYSHNGQYLRYGPVRARPAPAQPAPAARNTNTRAATQSSKKTANAAKQTPDTADAKKQAQPPPAQPPPPGGAADYYVHFLVPKHKQLREEQKKMYAELAKLPQLDKKADKDRQEILQKLKELTHDLLWFEKEIEEQKHELNLQGNIKLLCEFERLLAS